jgi:hypothetical protein
VKGDSRTVTGADNLATIATVPPYLGAVNDLAICDDEGLLMSVSGDTTLLVWGYGNRLGPVTAASTSNSGGGGAIAMALCGLRAGSTHPSSTHTALLRPQASHSDRFEASATVTAQSLAAHHRAPQSLDYTT